MSHYGTSVEYGIHCLLHLANMPEDAWTSAKEVAEFQGVSTAYAAKLFTRLQKGGIVRSAEGGRGGFRLARPASEISVLDVVDVLEGPKPLFRCREIRKDCVLHEGAPPKWVTNGVCAVHAVMLNAERSMRAQLGRTTLDTLANRVEAKAPAEFVRGTRAWFGERQVARGPGSRGGSEVA